MTPVFSRVFLDNILIGGLFSWLTPLLEVMGLTALLLAALIWIQSHILQRLSMKLSICRVGEVLLARASASDGVLRATLWR